MAPEILSNKEYDGKKCDIFAIGVILFMLVQENFPFETADPNNDQYYQKLVEGNLNDYWNEVAEGNTFSSEFKDLFQ